MKKMADENTMRRLWRYKSDLEQELDEEKLIEILGKLKRLAVTIAALQETGIGRVVNGYRKREGIVGDLARKVVGLWKSVVEAEVKTSKHRSPSQSPDHAASDAEAEDAAVADAEDQENAKDAENSSETESDATSWNSFKEEDSDNQSSSRRKRKHSVDSVDRQQGHGRSSENNKKDRHSKSESSKVDSAGDYIPSQKKKHTQEYGDHGNHSRHGHFTKGKVHIASIKEEGDKPSSSSQSKKDRDYKDSTSGHSVVRARSDSQIEHTKINRKQRRHSVSPSEEEEEDDEDHHHHEQASGSSLRSSKNVKPEHSLDSHKRSSSSGSHKASSSSHRHSHQSSRSSDSHMESPSLNAESHSSSSVSRKHSSTSDSRKLSSTSTSHRHSDSHSPSISSSHKQSSSNSHQHSSDSQKISSDSHKHSSSSRQHSSSTSHKYSSQNEEANSSLHHRLSASPSEQQTLEAASSEPQSSRHISNTSRNSGSSTSRSVSSRSHDHSADHHRSSEHKSRSHDRSGDASTSSKDNVRPHSSSKKSTVLESESSIKELQDNSLTKLKEKSAHSANRSLKDEGASDKHSSSKKHSEKENHKKKPDPSSSKQNNSHHSSEPSDSKSSSVVDSENQKPPNSSLSGNKAGETKSSSSKFTKIKPSSSNHKRSRHKDTYTQPDLDLFSEAIHIKAEPSSPVRKFTSSKPTEAVHVKKEPSSPVHKSASSKQTEAAHVKVEPSSPVHKFASSKQTEPAHVKKEPSSPVHKSASSKQTEAAHVKVEPSSPVHKSASSKQTDSKSEKSQSSSSSSKSALVLPDVKVKVESSVSEHKNTSGGSSSLKDARADTDEDSDSQQYTKYASGKDTKRKKVEVESPEHSENMSFEDFMAFDEAAMVKRGRSSVKSSSAKPTSSSSSSSKDSHSRVNKTSGGKSSSATDLPSSSKTGFSIPAPPTSVSITELDILSLLPETHASYKPLRFNNYYRDEDEREASPPPLVDPELIGTKTAKRTHVYSGRKHGITEVKPLYDLCMKVLIDNIDAIDCVGGIPYSILKPVLERCTAQQLYQLEDYNPHFLEDTEELWEVLCQRDFRGSKPDELETWRELYMRRFEERELKYQKLKQSMSTSISKGQAGRKAQLAYVDTVAKPPREVLRKQKQFGTGTVMRTKNNPNMKGSSSGLRTYKPSTLVPAHNPMEDRPRMVKAMPPMLAKSIQMRRNMRR